MVERCGYRTALYLSALIAAVNWSFWIYSRWYLPHLGNDAIYAVAAVVILIGLWLLSRIARYAGAAFYFLVAGVVAVTLWDFAKPVNVVVVWAVTTAVLSLAAALILVFSKPFAREFAAEREKRPPYKKYIHLRGRPRGSRRHTDRYRHFYPTSQQVTRMMRDQASKNPGCRCR